MIEAINVSHLNYLQPLLKWRIMNLNDLLQESDNPPKYKNFHRIIRSLESKKILEGHRDPYSKKKYIFLSHLGQSKLSLKDNPTAISRETIQHDLKVSEIAREFLRLDYVKDADLEHELNDKRFFNTTFGVMPDAVFHGERKGKKFKLAFELELSRKSHQRILEKAKQYSGSDYYDYALYFFSNQNFMNSYLKFLQEKLPAEQLRKFMFVFNSDLAKSPPELGQSRGYFQEKEISLDEIFGK